MKLYSDVLTPDNIHAAAPAGVGVELVAIRRARLRAHGWIVSLSDWNSNRHKNSGQHGAATWKAPAASWDQHGEWMAALYAIDPAMQVGPYKDADDFERQTGGKYTGATA